MNLGEIKVPSWLSVHRHAEEIMERIDPIPTAMLPPPDVEPPSVKESPEDEAMRRAAATMAKIKLERQQQLDENNRLAKENQNLRRENELLRLDVAQLQNNLATAQSQVETFRERDAESRAREGTAYRLARHLVAEYERAEIEMPKRKQRNGKPPQADAA